MAKQKKRLESERLKRSLFTRDERLLHAKTWLAKYNGKRNKIANSYRRYFSISWETAFEDLEILNIEINEGYKTNILQQIGKNPSPFKKKNKTSKNKNFPPSAISDKLKSVTRIVPSPVSIITDKVEASIFPEIESSITSERPSFDLQLKTVYILGAGFSKGLGAPLQNEIVREIFEQSLTTMQQHYDNVYARKLKRLANFLENELFIDRNDFSKIVLEDIFTPIDRCIIDNMAFRNISTTKLFDLRQSICALIAMMINYKLMGLSPNYTYADKFAEFLVTIKRNHKNIDSLCIISTNLDIIIDNAIKSQIHDNDGIIDYSCDVFPYYENEHSLSEFLEYDPNKFKIKILKLHGSMNWLKCQRCQRIFITFFEKIAVQEYLLRSNCRYCTRNHSNATRSNVRAALISDLVMPTFLKDLNNTQLKQIWNAAAMELSEAKKIVFMGYSFPFADFELRQLLSRTIRHDAIIEVVLRPSDDPNSSSAGLDREKMK